MNNQLVKQVKECYKKELEKILEQEHVNFNAAKKDLVEAEGRMVTRYDSTRTEVAWLANSRLVEIKALEKEIERVGCEQKANLGDIVTVNELLSSGETATRKYIIGAQEDHVQDVTYVGVNTPEGKALLGCMKEDRVEVEEKMRSRAMQIIDLQKRNEGSGVLVDTVVKVEDDEFGDEYYFVTEGRGGIILELEDETEVIVITTKSPLALALLGKQTEEVVQVEIGQGERVLKIKEILSE